MSENITKEQLTSLLNSVPEEQLNYFGSTAVLNMIFDSGLALMRAIEKAKMVLEVPDSVTLNIAVYVNTIPAALAYNKQAKALTAEQIADKESESEQWALNQLYKYVKAQIEASEQN